jgi:hypothetical protein
MKRKRITVQLTNMEMECLKSLVKDPAGLLSMVDGGVPDASMLATLATAREGFEKIEAAWKDAPEYKKRTVHARPLGTSVD